MAVFFAADEAEKFGLDAAVWCVRTSAVRDCLPSKWRDALKHDYAWLIDVRIIDKRVPDLAAFAIAFAEPMLVYFEPPSLDDRIVNQSGYVFGNVKSQRSNRPLAGSASGQLQTPHHSVTNWT